MSTKQDSLVKREDQRFREADASDIGASEAPRKQSALIQENTPLDQNEPQIPEEVQRAAHRRSIAKRIREDHEGSGYVIINTETGDIIDIVDDLREGRSSMESMDLPPDETLIISCNER